MIDFAVIIIILLDWLKNLKKELSRLLSDDVQVDLFCLGFNRYNLTLLVILRKTNRF